MPKVCEICNENPFKYKCSNCYIPYCSVACFKIHKEVPCQKPINPNESKGAPITTTAQTKHPEEPKATELTSLFEEDEEIYRLDTSHFSKLDESIDLKDSLRNPQLRKIIEYILASPNPTETIHILRNQHPEFEHLAQKLISIVDFHVKK